MAVSLRHTFSSLESLWAATGQAALESSRILVLSASATSTSILKNLVLPGIGHFTILDHQTVTPEDAGNNFFLEGHDSVGKSRAEEAVRLLGELNDGVEGVANTANFEELLKKDPEYFTSFSLIIAHNIRRDLLDDLSKLLWSSQEHPSLIVVRTAGFLAEFYIQYHEHDGGCFPHPLKQTSGLTFLKFSDREPLRNNAIASYRQTFPCTTRARDFH